MNIKTLVLGPVSTNCYICSEGKFGFVVDPAANAEKIYEEAKNLTVKYIIVTHAHFDHIEAAAKLKELTGAKLVISETDSKALNDSTLNLAAAFGALVPHVEADITVKDGETLSVDGFSIRFIMTPGHTQGSMCILVNNQYLFSGDTLFALSVGRTDFPGGSFKDIVNSVRKLFLLDDGIKVFPGHNETTSIGEEKKFNPYLNGDNT